MKQRHSNPINILEFLKPIVKQVSEEKEAKMRLKILLNKWKKLYPKTFLTLEKEFELFTTFQSLLQ